jgi:hypothetical protein
MDTNTIVARPEDSDLPESEVDLARYLAESARWEIGRTGQKGAALLSALSFVGTAAGAAFAILAKQGHHALAAVVLAVAAVLLLAAFEVIVLTIRPTLPAPGKATGWPVLTALDSETELPGHIAGHAAEPVKFYRDDARMLATIATSNHRLVRLACTLVLLAVPVGVLGGVIYALGL